LNYGKITNNHDHHAIALMITRLLD